MEENWIETQIRFNRKIFENEDDYKTLLLEIYKPIVSELEHKNYFLTFHFFFYRNFDTKFRVRIASKDYAKEVKQVVEKIWNIAQRFFEISCRFAISRIDDSFEKGKEYTDEKLIHCFCNQVHISRQEERNFYLRRLQNLGLKIEIK
jgi:hypothetical protein